MKIVCISDTHNLHDKIVVPEGDVLIHAGDATMRGYPHEVRAFLRWFSALPHPVKVFVPGNHDALFDTKNKQFGPETRRIIEAEYPTVEVLRDRYITLQNGMIVHGSPWLSGLMHWPFGWKSFDGRMAEYMAIPDEVDILVTHGPQHGVLDKYQGFVLGDEALALRIPQLTRLKLHVHGHIHESYGLKDHLRTRSDGTTVMWTTVNAAICDDAYSPVNAPIVVDL